MFKIAAYSTPIVALSWWYLDISIEFEDEEEEEEEKEVDGESVTFIPLGWPRKLPQEFYKGSDPEWQAFREFIGNHKQHIEIQSLWSIPL